MAPSCLATLAPGKCSKFFLSLVWRHTSHMPQIENGISRPKSQKFVDKQWCIDINRALLKHISNAYLKLTSARKIHDAVGSNCDISTLIKWLWYLVRVNYLIIQLQKIWTTLFLIWYSVRLEQWALQVLRLILHTCRKFKFRSWNWEPFYKLTLEYVSSFDILTISYIWTTSIQALF